MPDQQANSPWLRTIAGQPAVGASAERTRTTTMRDVERFTEMTGDVVKAMRTAYDVWWKKTRPLMVNETAPMSPTRPFHVLHARQLKAGGIPMWKSPKL